MAAPMESLRKRRGGGDAPQPEPLKAPGPEPPTCPPTLLPGTFWLTRIVLLRALAFIYFVAFLVAYNQNKQLIGEKGLLPSKLYLKQIQQYFKGKSAWDSFSYSPTIIWFLDWSYMDFILDSISLLGLGVSAFIIITSCANMILMAVLWILYFSLVHVGQIWYAFGK
ncbi:lipase maturation factor 1-like [Petaurus breviceps papuanus]|uniref:lipase maturation factor 1-like n=1 Tax=Petaurus breviceps papuanus TaxID=3040969 RepID=UPI0036DB4537